MLIRHFGIGCDPAPLVEIGSALGVTRQCVRQTEIRALRKLRQGPSAHFLQQLLEGETEASSPTA